MSRQLEKERFGSPSARARQPILKQKFNFLSFKIKFEPTFFQVLWRFAFSLLLQGEVGGRGVRGEFRPPSQSRAKSVRIFSNTHRQLEKERFGSPSARARQPILKQKFNFLSLFCETKRQKRAFHFLSKLNTFFNSKKPTMTIIAKAMDIN